MGLETGFTVNVVAPDYYVKRDSGLIIWDIAVGKGETPKAGQQVFFSFYVLLKKKTFLPFSCMRSATINSSIGQMHLFSTHYY